MKMNMNNKKYIFAALAFGFFTLGLSAKNISI